ncbi:MAG: hypothetical protein ACK451_18295, partial [Pseudanabaena sp.]
IKLIKPIAKPTARLLPDGNFALLTLTPVSTIASPHTHNNHQIFLENMKPFTVYVRLCNG